MPYIGVSPQFGVRRKHTYTATAGQTSFSGAGSEGATLSYTDSNFVDVYQNGVKLGDADYTSTSGTAIVLAQGASVDDLVEIIVFDAFSAADTVSKADGGTFDGNVTMAGTLDVTGNGTVGGTLGITGAVTANAGVSVDNITIDGTEIDLSSGDLTLDVAGNIILDADGGVVRFYDGGTQIGNFANNSSELHVNVSVQDKDFVINGNDGGSTVEAARFDMSAGGRLQLGGTNFLKNGDLQVFDGGVFRSTDYYNSTAVIVAYSASDTSGGIYVDFLNSSGTRIGAIKRNGTSAVSYNTSSDYRLKENVSYDFDATTRLKQLKPCRFNWISDETNTLIDGFIAHEVSSIVPEAISGEKDALEVWKSGEELPDGVSVGDNKLDEDGKTIINPQGIDQAKLVPLLVKTIQELEARITALEKGE